MASQIQIQLECHEAHKGGIKVYKISKNLPIYSNEYDKLVKKINEFLEDLNEI